MKKIFIILSLLLITVIGCSKKESDTDNWTDECYNCTIIQKWYSNGTLTNTTNTTDVHCFKIADKVSYEMVNTHSDTSLIQTCNCVKQ